MRQIVSLRHTRWECKYHVVFIPKYRRKAIFGQIRREFVSFRQGCRGRLMGAQSALVSASAPERASASV